MLRLSSTLTAPLLLCFGLLAQVQPGDLVMMYPGSPDSVIQATAFDGTLNLSIQGITSGLPSTTSWISTAQMPDGRFVVHNNNGGSYLAFFSELGVLLSQFPVTPSNYASFDNLELHAAQLPPGKPSAAFVGDQLLNGGNGLPFADGLRCAGGSLVMLGVRMANTQGNASWGPGMQTLGGWSGLDTRYFQVWYRDTSSPCGVNVNLTNAVEVTFQP